STLRTSTPLTMQSSAEPSSAGYDLTMDHPGYELPVSNITYHVYAEDNRMTDGEAVAQKAFQRIMDSYEEYEKLTDVFQIELDRRQQLVNERKQHEKLLREERQRLQKEQKRSKRLGKTTIAPSSSSILALGSNINCSKQYLSSLPRTSASSMHYHPYRNTAVVNSLTDPHRSFDRYGYDQTQGSALVVASSDSHSHLSPDHPPHLIHSVVASGDRSPSSSPLLPLTPSPQLKSSDSLVGLVASTSAASMSASSSSSATPFSMSGSTSSFATSAFSGAQQQQHQHQPERMRKKRKQAIPVHPSVVDRIPGITLRIQPDSDQQLQVEILKNVEDYQSTQALVATHSIKDGELILDLGHNELGHLDWMTQYEHNKGSIERRNGLALEARQQDIDKVRESIESGRPGYANSPSNHHKVAMIQDLDLAAHATVLGERGHSQKHQRQDSVSSNKSLDFHHPTGAGLDRNTDNSGRRSPSTSAATLHSWAPPRPSIDFYGPSVASEEIEAARAAALPLSWDNFTTRECQVNKVIGKHDKDFALLEEVVQDAVARQHAAQLAAYDSDDQSVDKARSHRSSNQHLDREGSSPSARSTPAASASSFSKAAGSRTSAKATHGSTSAVTSSSSRAAGTRATRGEATGLVETYDDIERVLREKRIKKREERQRRESAITDPDHDYHDDHDGEDHDGHVMKAEDGCISGPDDDGYMEETASPYQKSLHRKKSLTLSLKDDHHQSTSVSKTSAQPTSPPSPPHSRQMTPFKGESTTTSRRSSVSSRHHTYTNAALGATVSNTSSTPPATPTRATVPPLPPLFSSGQEEASQPTQDRRARTRSRSMSISSSIPMPSLVAPSAEGKNKNSFFDAALDQIEAKRRQQVAKKKAAAAAAAAATTTAAAATLPDIVMAKEALFAEPMTPETVDPHALERELHSLKSLETGVTTSGNLPKSSKYLPGRILRTARTPIHDPMYVMDGVASPGLGSSSLASGVPPNKMGVKSVSKDRQGAVAAGQGRRGDAAAPRVNVESLDPDCGSCRMAVTSLDKALWQEACESGAIQLNPKRWGKTAILCVACREQYQKHQLRCTQCFYVPVLGTGGSLPKAGGRCCRCKAGTWLLEN
ncbi:hypothetical protein BGZ98_010250, partial [Dissophora globulifera]